MKDTKTTTLTYTTEDYTLNPPDTSDIEYVLISDDVTADGETCTIYGIGAKHNEKIIARVPDISADYGKIKALVEECNKGKLSLIHLTDIAEDAVI